MTIRRDYVFVTEEMPDLATLPSTSYRYWRLISPKLTRRFCMASTMVMVFLLLAVVAVAATRDSIACY